METRAGGRRIDGRREEEGGRHGGEYGISVGEAAEENFSVRISV
jgi:hypothetical protein